MNEDSDYENDFQRRFVGLAGVEILLRSVTVVDGCVLTKRSVTNLPLIALR